jgi:hypothetical protein
MPVPEAIVAGCLFVLAAAHSILGETDVLRPLFAAMCLCTAAMIFVVLRSHLAWPLFLLAGLAALHADGHLSERVFQVGAAVTTITLIAAALVHVYWAAGGSWMADRATPTTSGRAVAPGPVPTLAVAAALGVFSALVSLVAFDAGPDQARWLVIAGVVVFGLRAIGDTKVAGFTKTVRDSAFASADDRWFTPLVVFLALGATGALLA